MKGKTTKTMTREQLISQARRKLQRNADTAEKLAAKGARRARAIFRDGDGLLHCPHCRKPYESLTYLAKHVDWVHGDQPLYEALRTHWTEMRLGRMPPHSRGAVARAMNSLCNNTRFSIWVEWERHYVKKEDGDYIPAPVFIDYGVQEVVVSRPLAGPNIVTLIAEAEQYLIDRGYEWKESEE